MESLAKRLAKARLTAKLSQAALAKGLSQAQSTVATWERGKNEPDLVTIVKLAKHLGRTPEWLAFGVNDNFSADLTLVPEIDARAASGAPGLLDAMEDDPSAVIRRYGLPKSEFRSLFGTDPEGVVILEVRGDSMQGTLVPGERVVVDRLDRTPTPPGIFVVWDGLGLVLKRVEFIPHSDPPSVRIVSDNPRYEPYERTLDEAYIQGRVIAHWRRT